jgi:hypothetical protein
MWKYISTSSSFKPKVIPSHITSPYYCKSCDIDCKNHGALVSHNQWKHVSITYYYIILFL